MRPKLKSDVLYVPTEDGVHVFGAGADIALRGRSAYQWLDRLAPHLDGTTELDRLVGALPEDKRAAVSALVERLHGAGCLVDASEDLPHRLTGHELAMYAREIAFVEYHRSSPARHFETYRDSAVVVVGAGPVFVSLVASALRSGVRALRAVETSELPTDRARLAELAAEAAVRDPEQTLDHVALPSPDPSGRDTALPAREEARIAAADAVLHVAEGPAVQRAVRLDRLCRDSGTLLVQGLVLDDVAWLGPAGPPWESAWLRLGLRGPFRKNRFRTGPAAAVVAGQLGLAAFRVLTGVAPPPAAAPDAPLVRIDLETLRTSAHAFLPHPSALPAGPERAADFTARVERLRTADAPDAGEFSARAARCFDPYVGVLRRLDERGFTQLPLNVTEAVPHDEGAPRVFAAGLGSDAASGFAVARRRAALRGLAVYAAGAVDPRRLGPAATVWGRDLTDGRTVAVPADRAFGTGPGLAARLGWAEAEAEGLGQWCADLALTDVRTGRARPQGLRLPFAVDGSDAGRLYGLLRAAGGDVRVADIGGALGVPVLVWWQDGRPIAATCGPDALTEGLERAVLDRQAALSGDRDYAPEPLTGVAGPPAGVSDGRMTAHGAGTAEMLSALRSRGLRPVAVPLDHDPVVHEVLPSVLRVVLVDG
ncbi:hypothetical protein ACH4SP_26750 [Streptomyces sp. NPDC021093]|uniref:hypothetical protein n=1 Tax=Streptomyces sp. NPDC021093 TaxID=3365112 RepID=UPI0037887598